MCLYEMSRLVNLDRPSPKIIPTNKGVLLFVYFLCIKYNARVYSVIMIYMLNNIQLLAGSVIERSIKCTNLPKKL